MGRMMPRSSRRQNLTPTSKTTVIRLRLVNTNLDTVATSWLVSVSLIKPCKQVGSITLSCGSLMCTVLTTIWVASGILCWPLKAGGLFLPGFNQDEYAHIPVLPLTRRFDALAGPLPKMYGMQSSSASIRVQKFMESLYI